MSPDRDADGDRLREAVRDHVRIVAALEGRLDEVLEVAELLAARLAAGSAVYWLGNGGSAADAQHLAAELVGRFRAERPAWRSVALTTNPSILTAVANDYGFETVFARQVEGLCREGDVVIGISTSGASPNVVEAMRTASRLGAHTVGLTGWDGGELAGAVDRCLRVPSEDTARIQEAHILLGHLVCESVERRLAAGEDRGSA